MKHSRLNLAGRDEEPDRYTHKKQGKRPAHDRAAVLVLEPRPRDVADTIRQRIIEARTDNRALTMDVTGRNIPAVTSPTVWLFVEAINRHVLPPRWDTAYLRYAVRQARMTGFYLFAAGQVLPPPAQTC